MSHFQKTLFICSAHNLSQCPADEGFEVAFAGRSNVGKSSVINCLTGNNKLARISKTPGRTQLLNFFSVTENTRLVDLPGYGFARVPQKIRQHWGALLQGYFETRRSLAGLILIMDIRHPLKPFDRQLLAWCQSTGLPVHVVLNKADKISRGAGLDCRKTVEAELQQRGVSVQLFSAQNRNGVAELQMCLDIWLGFSDKKTAPVCQGEGRHPGA